MPEEQTLTIYAGQPLEETTPAPEIDIIPSLDQLVQTWITTQANHSGSKETEHAYRLTITQFRHELQHQGLDLDSHPRAVATLARAWAASRSPLSYRAQQEIAPATYNRRLAILSSFYQFAVKEEVLQVNPLDRVARRKPAKKEAAHPLSKQAVRDGLAKLDRSTIEGLRNYALFSVALETKSSMNAIEAHPIPLSERIGTSCG